MTLVRYGQAAMIAAIMTLAGNAVTAQESEPHSGPVTPNYINFFTPVLHCCKDGKCNKETCAAKDCCAANGCCKDGKCCKDGEGCNNSQKCNAKANCCNSGGCCNGANEKSCCKETNCDHCPFVNKLAKQTAIIMVMPASLPLLRAYHPEMMGMLPHPPMPLGPHVLLPPPMPPVPFPHPVQVQVNEDNTGNLIFGYGVNSNTCVGGRICSAGQIPAPYAIAAATPAAKVQIVATPSSKELEIHVGDETCINCKKMTVKIGENEISVSRFDDRVRIRGEELKATAGTVYTDGKDRIILEGDVVLHYKHDGHTANVIGERIELNLSSSDMTIQRTATTSSRYLQHPPTYFPPSPPFPLTPERVHGGIEP